MDMYMYVYVRVFKQSCYRTSRWHLYWVGVLLGLAGFDKGKRANDPRSEPAEKRKVPLIPETAFVLRPFL